MRKLMEPILLQEESNLRGTIAQRDNVKKKKRDAWPGQEMMHLFQTFSLWQQGLEQHRKTCVCAPATGIHRDVLGKTALIHPVRCNSNQKLCEHAQTHLLATSNLLQAEGFNEHTLRGKAKLLRGGGCWFPPPSAHSAPLNSRSQHEHIV